MDNNVQWSNYSDLDLVYLYTNCIDKKDEAKIKKELQAREIDLSYENLKTILLDD